MQNIFHLIAEHSGSIKNPWINDKILFPSYAKEDIVE